MRRKGTAFYFLIDGNGHRADPVNFYSLFAAKRALRAVPLAERIRKKLDIGSGWRDDPPEDGDK